MIRRLFATFVLIGLFGASSTLAQIVIDFPAISGIAGQLVTVPVRMNNVEASPGFDSFQFTVVSSSSNVAFVTAFRTATLIPESWTFLANSTYNNGVTPPGPNNVVAGFGALNTKVVTSGVFLFLQFKIVTPTAGTTVELRNFTMASSTNQGSAPPVPFTPVVPTSTLSVNVTPVPTNDSYQVNEGSTLTVPVGTGVLANDTDANSDPLTSIVGITTVNGALTLATNGSFTYVHNGSETISDSFTYTVSDGSTSATGTVNITIVPVNDAPVFTSQILSQSVDEGALVSGTYTATDAEGSALTYALVSGPAGAAVNGTTGAFGFLTTTGGSGVYTIIVSVSDGTATTQSTFTLTVRSVVRYSGTLSGAHQTTVVQTTAAGSMAAEYVTNTKELVISGTFSGLTSSMVSAQVQVGNTTQNGDGILILNATLVGNGSAGNFSGLSNTFNLSTYVFPTGWNVTLFEQALAAGNVYVNLRSLTVLSGELRTQLRLLTNTAPVAINVAGPNSVNVSGAPSANAYSLTWQPGAADGQGDATKLVLESASDVLFGTLLSVTDVTTSPSQTFSFTVDASAKLYDQLSGSTPGNVSIGGTKTVFYRLRRTDGSALSTGNPIGVVLTRGLVTDKQKEASLPEEFVLLGNYPNPFNPTTTIQFDLPESADVQVDVLDLLGRTMISIPSQAFEAGTKKSVSVDASALPSGIYMYRVSVRSAKQTLFSTGTMTLIK